MSFKAVKINRIGSKPFVHSKFDSILLDQLLLKHGEKFLFADLKTSKFSIERSAFTWLGISAFANSTVCAKFENEMLTIIN